MKTKSQIYGEVMRRGGIPYLDTIEGQSLYREYLAAHDDGPTKADTRTASEFSRRMGEREQGVFDEIKTMATARAKRDGTDYPTAFNAVMYDSPVLYARYLLAQQIDAQGPVQDDESAPGPRTKLVDEGALGPQPVERSSKRTERNFSEPSKWVFVPESQAVSRATVARQSKAILDFAERHPKASPIELRAALVAAI